MTRGALVLSNGSVYKGTLFGDLEGALGEVVFQTGMVGYCESLTDPSYCRQILVLTYPIIGNYGVPAGPFESERIWPAGLVCSNLSEYYSHCSATRSLDDWMREHKRPGLQGIDTRKLTKELRAYGTLVGRIVSLDSILSDPITSITDTTTSTISRQESDELIDDQLQKLAEKLRTDPELINYPANLNLVDEVSPKQTIITNEGYFPRIMLVDCGAKNNIARCLESRGVRVQRVPWNYDIVSNVKEFDGLMLSNGPGDPGQCQPLIDQLKKLFDNDNFKKPVFGICLGHQLIGLAAGYKSYKLPYGNRGHNQPCRLTGTDRCLITSQNHGFALQTANDVSPTTSENWSELFINQNDKSNEGITHKTKPFFSVQFHPEHNAGPTDSEFLFQVFVDSVVRYLEGSNGYNHIEMIHRHLNQNQSARPAGVKKVLILGSGGLSIGQAGEFDYSGSQAIKALKSENIFTILINPNIATVQTSPSLVDRVYFLPVTGHYVTEVIKRERPDGLMLMFGGQTALNCGIELEDSGVLNEYKVQVLGPPIQTIRNSEDRRLFSDMMEEINVKVAPSIAVNTVEEALVAAKETLGYPILVRAAYALGGLGSGFAHDERELKNLVTKALVHSTQVLLDQSLKGWKELEYEVVRDIYDNCATICNMENVDPLGIHTGESIVIAPSQTLNDFEYNKLREVAIRVVRHLGVIGECNVQYAVNPNPKDKEIEFYVIEVNPRLSRSSALASKATGYPLAYIAAKLALGNSLTELCNTVTSSELTKTTACFEPSLDYCVVKIPRWDLAKFAGVTHEIGSSMKSVGEVMAIGRSFEEAFQKALRMVSDSNTGFDAETKPGTRAALANSLRKPTDRRIFAIAAAMEMGFTIDELYKLTSIDRWFLAKMMKIVDMKQELRSKPLPLLDLHDEEFREILLRAKKMGFSDKQIGLLVGGNELMIRKARCDYHNIMPFVKQVDTVAAEWPAQTNYLYLTYQAEESDIVLSDRTRRSRTRTISVSVSQSTSPRKPEKGSRLAETIAMASQNNSEPEQVMVLGSGVYRIGSSVEFDCCAVGCVQELRSMNKKVIMLNYNPETVSTDFDECEKLYFDEISFEVVMDIYNLEQPQGIVISMGGQTPNNIAMQLNGQKAYILGTSPEDIDSAEDRFKFSRLLDTKHIDQPKWKNAVDQADAFKFCKDVGYPCIIRPSYVLSGAAMNVAYTDEDLEKFLKQAKEVSLKHPVVISKFIEDAKEIDIDGVAQYGKLVCMAVSEHVENAGVHSGDATLVTPPQDLNPETLSQIKEICSKIVLALNVNGPFNIQLIAKDNQLRVIECNLRASRSFPFVSKTLNYNFIATATKVILGVEVKPVDVTFGQLQPKSNYVSRVTSDKHVRVGVKVPQFSFSRLSGADIKLGVEMASTGEVACFGDNRFSAYLKALISTGFRLPERKRVLISIGSLKHKKEFISSIKTLAEMNYEIYATQGTADYYRTKISNKSDLNGSDSNGEPKLQLHWIDWPFGEVGSQSTSHDEIDNIFSYLSAKEFDMVINLPMTSAGARRVSTLGYRTRRFAVDHSVPLISDIKCAKLLIEALRRLDKMNIKAPLVNDLDCLCSANIITLPGLIDVHVHVREPGATEKEDFDTATAAALAGGVTFIGVMPNTNPPIIDRNTLKQEQELAKSKARCDYGLIVGATPDNAQDLASLTSTEPILALKMYLNNTYGTLCMSDTHHWVDHFQNWPEHLPICVHAEGKTAAAAILLASRYDKCVHICHISTAEEILFIKLAKAQGIKVTCEVAPHHLFLGKDNFTNDDVENRKFTVKPPLMTAQDQQALLDNLDSIDCFATDHAPHLMHEKMAACSCPGFPGLETMLPLLLDAATSKKYPKLTIKRIVDMLYTNPKRIFNIPDQPDTSIEVDLNRTWRIGQDRPYYSRANWSPFDGWLVRGKVIKVTLRGQVAFVDDKVIAEPGSGRELDIKSHEVVSFSKSSTPAPIQVAVQESDDSSSGEQHKNAIQHHQQQKEQQSPYVNPSLRACHILNIDLFDRAILHDLFNLAEHYYKEDRNNRPIEPILAGKVMASMFYEPSTRTEWSMAAAMMRLGGSEKKFNSATSSTTKGETFSDTIKMLASYCHVIVLRHPEPGKVTEAAEVLDNPSFVNPKSIINAGDGTGEHPTQALLDVFTIRKEIGTLTNLIVTMVGDLKHGRTVHSLAKLLCNYEIQELRFVSPDGLEMPQEVRDYLEERCIVYSHRNSLDADTIEKSDVIYMTRIQKERFESIEQYERCSGQLKITPLLMSRAKQKMIVMHPLPRVDEISTDFDDDSRAVYFKQAEYGLFVRMALLHMVLS